MLLPVRSVKPKAGKGQVVLFNLCGHGHFDMTAWNDFNAGTMVEHAYPEEAVAKSMADIPPVEMASTAADSADAPDVGAEA